VCACGLPHCVHRVVESNAPQRHFAAACGAILLSIRNARWLVSGHGSFSRWIGGYLRHLPLDLWTDFRFDLIHLSDYTAGAFHLPSRCHLGRAFYLSRTDWVWLYSRFFIIALGAPKWGGRLFRCARVCSSRLAPRGTRQCGPQNLYSDAWRSCVGKNSLDSLLSHRRTPRRYRRGIHRCQS